MISLPQPSMDEEKLTELIARLGSNVEGHPGFWKFEYGSVPIVCITDEAHDRMRIMTPIAALEEVSPKEIVTCMEANFDRSIDVRYCINDGTLWSIFLHPLSSLTVSLFHSACYQINEAAKNFGGSFSSGALNFNPNIT